MHDLVTHELQPEYQQIQWTDSQILQARIAHLGFIQGVINRMGLNSFLAKGWTATMTAAIFTLSGRENDRRFIVVALFVVSVFWLLDAYCLHQERIYRKLYDKVASGVISSRRFDLVPSGLCKEVPSELRVFFSKTLLLYYGVMVGAVVFVMFALLRP